MMRKSRTHVLGGQSLISITLFLMGIWIAWQLGGTIASGNLHTLEFAALGLACCGAALAILRNWRAGFYFFLVWLLFEDLVRKYMGNGLALFFGKDILAALIYLSLYAAIRRGREKTFRPPFLLPLAVFVWFGAIQIFNSNSPSILYGLLGFKLYFFYIPLIWVGYALIRSDEDLWKFLVVNAAVAVVIASVGITQAILGNSFANPRVLAPDIAGLGNLDKVSPISRQVFNLPDSVFVSSGRYGAYLLVVFILVIGAAGYLFLGARRGRSVVFLAIGFLGAAALLSGSRGTIVYIAASALVMAVSFLWGAPWRQRQAHRLVKAIRRSAIVGALGLAAILVLFPEQAGSRIAFYRETLSPSSSAYAGAYRGWTYPLENLIGAFTGPHWVLGNGIGVASLGTQYVARLLGEGRPEIWVEEGFGVLVVELGVLGPFLWILWSGALLYCCWSVVRRLRGTRFFPFAFAAFWYALLLLWILMWGGFAVYQNFVNNAYLWILVGMLFRLPDLLGNTVSVAARASSETQNIVQSTRHDTHSETSPG
jgi:hypothetical protein